ncbi:uncharacterized protein LOC129721676 isoform X2 [Wyeomyia smithii]|uniref:uncharacterized protein LOC129721676 isoform X2 n=1 Tax=Wyeomyia smithii TaxID=174621 RepID=UPI002467EFD3|nr:uncharacterized protein LOC129721676 isoform X2 [Wyeomyia smithii]
MEGKVLFESKHCISLKCVLFLFYGGLGCIYPFLQSNMAHKGFDYNEIYSISIIIPIAALFGPLLFALLVDKWATSSAFAYGKRVRILTALSLLASIVLYAILMFGVERNSPPPLCQPQVSFMCNKKGAYLLQEKCTAEGVCHDWDHNKAGLLNLEHCSYSCQQEAHFESNCYQRQEHDLRLAALRDSDEDDGDDSDDVADESEAIRTDDGSGGGNTASSNDLDGDGIPNDQDPDDDNDGILDSQDDDDDNDGIPDAQDMDDDNDGIPDSVDADSKMTANDLDGDGIPNDQDPDDDNDGIPDVLDDDDDNDGVPDAQDDDDDNDGIPDAADSDAQSKGNDLDGDGIPNDQDDDDDNDGIPDIQDTDDDNDGVPDVLDSDDDNDGIPDIKDKDAVYKPNDLDGDDTEDDDDDNDGIPDTEDVDDDNDGIPDVLEGKPLSDDLDGDGIPNDADDDDDNDGIPDAEDTDDDNDGIPDAIDLDDDNDGVLDVLDEGSRNANDLDGDGIPNEMDDDDDNDGIPDSTDNDDDNDGIPDSIDPDDDNDGISDTKENKESEFLAPKICHDPAADSSDEVDDDDDDDEKCYSANGEVIQVKASIDEHSERDDGEECIYPLDGFKCHIDKAWIKTQEQGCKSVIECSLQKPYESNTSLLYETNCDGDEDNDGDDDMGDSTYYFYLSIRSLLDFFLLAALTLFNTIIVIVTRDPSTGVADFGRQLVWGAIGWIVFFNDDYEQPYFLFILLNTTAAIILLSPLKMDLSPPEHWWRFKTTPQKCFSAAAFVKYAKKCWLPFLITLGLGSLWSIIDSIDETHMIDIPTESDTSEPRRAAGLKNVWKTFLLAGDLLAVPALVFSKRIIEVFGVCKIFVAAFLSLVLRYILLAIFDWQFWDIIEDLLLPTTLGLTWVTIVMHFRDILPRKITAIAQALPVIAHFGFGRFFGALIGIENDYDHLENDYEIIAGVLFAITIVSIVMYRYRELILHYLGQYIPSLKPSETEKVTTNGKGETDV